VGKRRQKNDFSVAIGLSVFGGLLLAELVIVNAFPKPNLFTPPIPDAIFGLCLFVLDYAVVWYVLKRYRSRPPKGNSGKLGVNHPSG
jgi:hypothetical protein